MFEHLICGVGWLVGSLGSVVACCGSYQEGKDFVLSSGVALNGRDLILEGRTDMGTISR